MSIENQAKEWGSVELIMRELHPTINTAAMGVVDLATLARFTLDSAYHSRTDLERCRLFSRDILSRYK